MNDFKLIFNLVQHTPLIHFQGDQQGATLRATELKPKLDEFLWRKFKNEAILPMEEWLIKGQKKALNYKIKIIAEGVKFKEIKETIKKEIKDTRKDKEINNAPMFFGSIGMEEKSALKLSFADKIKVEIFSYNSELTKHIKRCFPEFIFQTNFGTRQSKGYGSFFCADGRTKDLKKATYLLINDVPKGQYKKVFEIINYYYQRLKSGINYRNSNQYEHAFLKLYLSENTDYEWEKPWLKETFIPNANRKPGQKKFARAMLGLGGNFTFKRKPRDPKKGEVYPDRDFDIKVSHSSNSITRHKSPITFKPIFLGNEWRVYIHLSTIEDGIQNQQFKFSKPGKADTLKTPEKSFDLLELISSYHISLGYEFEAYNFSNRLGKVKIIHP